jgi:hypothetical protein
MKEVRGNMNSEGGTKRGGGAPERGRWSVEVMEQ